MDKYRLEDDDEDDKFIFGRKNQETKVEEKKEEVKKDNEEAKVADSNTYNQRKMKVFQGFVQKEENLAEDFLETPWRVPSIELAKQYKRNQVYLEGQAYMGNISITSASELGVGIRMYFHFVKSMTVALAIMTFLALPTIFFTYYGNGMSTDEQDAAGVYKYTLGNFGKTTDYFTLNNIEQYGNTTYTTFMGYSFEYYQANLVITGCDFLQVVVFLIAVLHLQRRMKQYTNHEESRNQVSITHYAVYVENLPRDTTEDELIEHFSNLYGLDKVDWRHRLPVEDARPVQNVENTGDPRYINTWVAELFVYRKLGEFLIDYEKNLDLLHNLYRTRSQLKLYKRDTSYAHGENRLLFQKKENEMLHLAQKVDKFHERNYRKFDYYLRKLDGINDKNKQERENKPAVGDELVMDAKSEKTVVEDVTDNIGETEGGEGEGKEGDGGDSPGKGRRKTVRNRRSQMAKENDESKEKEKEAGGEKSDADKGDEEEGKAKEKQDDESDVEEQIIKEPEAPPEAPKLVDPRIEYSKKAPIIGAFVCFEYNESFARCVEDYTLYNSFPFSLFFPRQLLFKNRRLKITRALEPDQIKYEYLEYSSLNRRLLLCRTFFFTILLMIGTFMVLFLVSHYKYTFQNQIPSDTVCANIVPSLYLPEDVISSATSSSTSLSSVIKKMSFVRPPDEVQWHYDHNCSQYVDNSFYLVYSMEGSFDQPSRNYSFDACPLMFPPTPTPSFSPTILPSTLPTIMPTDIPTMDPASVPTFTPSETPSYEPSNGPTAAPTDTFAPSMSPTEVPSNEPTFLPSAAPTDTSVPSVTPSRTPTNDPTFSPSAVPTDTPAPSMSPTEVPSNSPTFSPTAVPSTETPTYDPTVNPTEAPTVDPTYYPTVAPTDTPIPTENPTEAPSNNPTASPSAAPTVNPTEAPTFDPTYNPTAAPTDTDAPTEAPTASVRRHLAVQKTAMYNKVYDLAYLLLLQGMVNSTQIAQESYCPLYNQTYTCPCVTTNPIPTSLTCSSLSCQVSGVNTGSTTGSECSQFPAKDLALCYCKQLVFSHLNTNDILSYFFKYILVWDSSSSSSSEGLFSVDAQYCSEFNGQFVSSYILSYASIIFTIGINLLLKYTLIFLTPFEGHQSIDDEQTSILFKLFISMYFNMALIILIANGLNVEITFWSGVKISKGPHTDFTRPWYGYIGFYIVSTLFLTVLSSLCEKYVFLYIYPIIRRNVYNYYIARKKCTSKTIQSDVNDLQVGARFMPTLHSAQLLSILFFTMTYSTGIPVLVPITLVSYLVMFRLDKYLLGHYYRKPYILDAVQMKYVLSWLPYAAIIRLVASVWMLSADGILPYVFKNYAGYDQTVPGGFNTNLVSTANYEWVVLQVQSLYTNNLSSFVPEQAQFAVHRALRSNTLPFTFLLVLIIAMLILQYLWSLLPMRYIYRWYYKSVLLSKKKAGIFNASRAKGYIHPFDLILTTQDPLRQEAAPYTGIYYQFVNKKQAPAGKAKKNGSKTSSSSAAADNDDIGKEETSDEGKLCKMMCLTYCDCFGWLSRWATIAPEVNPKMSSSDNKKKANEENDEEMNREQIEEELQKAMSSTNKKMKGYQLADGWEITDMGFDFEVKVKRWTTTSVVEDPLQRFKGQNKRTFEVIDDFRCNTYHLGFIPKYQYAFLALTNPDSRYHLVGGKARVFSIYEDYMVRKVEYDQHFLFDPKREEYNLWKHLQVFDRLWADRKKLRKVHPVNTDEMEKEDDDDQDLEMGGVPKIKPASTTGDSKNAAKTTAKKETGKDMKNPLNSNNTEDSEDEEDSSDEDDSDEEEDDDSEEEDTSEEDEEDSGDEDSGEEDSEEEDGEEEEESEEESEEEESEESGSGEDEESDESDA